MSSSAGAAGAVGLQTLGFWTSLRERASQYARSKARVRVRPKRYFCDPSLAAALLGATPERLLGDMQTLGMLFENLVLRDVRVFLSTYGGVDNSVHYFRDEKGLEVDLIVEHDGRWGAIEVKLSETRQTTEREISRRWRRKCSPILPHRMLRRRFWRSWLERGASPTRATTAWR